MSNFVRLNWDLVYEKAQEQAQPDDLVAYWKDRAERAEATLRSLAFNSELRTFHWSDKE